MNKTVLIIIPYLKIGGEEKVTLEAAKALKASRLRILCLTSGGPLEQQFNDEGIRVIKEKVSGRSILGMVRAVRIVRGILKSHSVDIVQCQEVLPVIFVFIAQLFCKTRLPVIWQDLGVHRYTYPLIGLLFNFMLTAVIATSEFEKQMLIKHGVRARKIRKIHNGVTLEKFLTDEIQPDFCHQFKKEFGIARESYVVTTIARLTYEKGVKYFIKAIPYICESVCNVHFLVVGDGPQLQRLKRMAASEIAQRRITFTGFRCDIREILSMSDVVVVPSIREASPVTVIEAQIMGVPVVGSNVGGIPEEIRECETGLLFRSRNYRELADKVITILSDKTRFRGLMEVHRHKILSYYGLKRMQHQLVDMYDEILANGKYSASEI